MTTTYTLTDSDGDAIATFETRAAALQHVEQHYGPARVTSSDPEEHVDTLWCAEAGVHIYLVTLTEDL